MTEFLYNIFIFPITEIINLLFNLFYITFGNVYYSIFIVSFFVNIMCLPMYLQAEKIQEEEHKIQAQMLPQVKSIKKNFKGEEQFMLLNTCYRQHNYNPVMALRTSLGLLIQIPFLMAAYMYFSHLEILENTLFINSKVLSLPDGLLTIFGVSVNILPILMTVINIISAEVYAFDKQFKGRLQMYSFAIIFLILLYNSPAGLVIYWTLNNIFSLCKNIALKTKNPKNILNKSCIIIAFLILLKIILMQFDFMYGSSKELYIIVSCILLYFIFNIIPVNLKEKFKNCIESVKVYDYKLFFISALVLTVVTGVLIPVIVISSSMDFVEYLYKNVWNVILSIFTKSVGVYLFWPIVLYYFANKKIRSVLTVLFSFLALFFTVNLCMYNGELGVLSLDFSFKMPQYSIFKLMLDFCIMCIIILSVYLCLIKYKNKYFKSIITCLLLASAGFSVIRILKIHNNLTTYSKNFEPSQVSENLYKPIKLSKHGKNVIVIFLDRAPGFYAREIFEENPDLQNKFRGFVLYPNTISFQGQTYMGYTAMIGGYEYTPVNIKEKTGQTFKQIISEAYLVLPEIFINNGFPSTILRPQTFNNNEDYSMYNNSGINLFKSENFDDYYNSLEHDAHEKSVLMNLKSNLNMKIPLAKRFLYFSNYMVCPSFIKKVFYKCFKNDSGVWDEFLVGQYKHLASMQAYTDIENSGKGYFTLFNNHIVHINKYDQFYPKEHKYLEEEAFYIIAEYIDFLKENNIYNNTRIIIVADHGYDYQDNLYLDQRYTAFNPLLMVKDFNSDGKFIFNFDFMTNADMPILATKDIISNPVNPYTGKYIKKFVDKKSVKIICRILREEERYKLSDGPYYEVRDNIFKAENWKLLKKK